MDGERKAIHDLVGWGRRVGKFERPPHLGGRGIKTLPVKSPEIEARSAKEGAPRKRVRLVQIPRGEP